MILNGVSYFVETSYCTVNDREVCFVLNVSVLHPSLQSQWEMNYTLYEDKNDIWNGITFNH